MDFTDVCFEDTKWKQIQKNAFTAWINERLKGINEHIENLETDLSDRLKLVSLIEVLAQSKISKCNKRPTFRSQKLENVSLALNFLQNEGIRIVNIHPTDIVDCKLKLISGLIWTLIKHYSFSMLTLEEECQESSTTTNPKRRLLKWIQSKISDLPISNFTSDWNDGRAIGALVNAIAPGLCPDWKYWYPKDAVMNATKAMALAESRLQIPKLIKAEDMTNPNVDEMSIMIYLSEYAKVNIPPEILSGPRIYPKRVQAYGPGIESTGPVTDIPVNFLIDSTNAGEGDIHITLEDPMSNTCPVHIDKLITNNKSSIHLVTYTPKVEGFYKVQVHFGDTEIPKSPFFVMVKNQFTDSSKITISGPGLPPNEVFVNTQTYIDISTAVAGCGLLDVMLFNPNGYKVPVKFYKQSPDVWRCEYLPSIIGQYLLYLIFAGKAIPQCPIAIKVFPNVAKCLVFGRGVLENSVCVKEDVIFTIITKDVGKGIPECSVIGPEGKGLPILLMKQNATTYKCCYSPQKTGCHMVKLSFCGKEVPFSPFKVHVEPYKEKRLTIFGPGLNGGIVGYLAKLLIKCKETGKLNVSITGPSNINVYRIDNDDGTVDISYLPLHPGYHFVNICYDNEHILGSPCVAYIFPKMKCDPNEVKVSGPGISREGVELNKKTEFIINRQNAGEAQLDIIIRNGYGKTVPYYVEEYDEIYRIQYVPKTTKKHFIMVNYGNVAVQNSPFKVPILIPNDPLKVQAVGPGLESNVKLYEPTEFTVNCNEAGTGDLKVTIKDPNDANVPISLTNNQDGTYTVTYVAITPGNYTVDITYRGSRVTALPIIVNVNDLEMVCQ